MAAIASALGLAPLSGSFICAYVALAGRLFFLVRMARQLRRSNAGLKRDSLASGCGHQKFGDFNFRKWLLNCEKCETNPSQNLATIRYAHGTTAGRDEQNKFVGGTKKLAPDDKSNS